MLYLGLETLFKPCAVLRAMRAGTVLTAVGEGGVGVVRRVADVGGDVLGVVKTIIAKPLEVLGEVRDLQSGSTWCRRFTGELCS